MKKSKVEFNVIKDFNGLIGSGELIEKIIRMPQKVMFGERGNKRTKFGMYKVSYKGKWYISFPLHGAYGELSGLCIDIKER